MRHVSTMISFALLTTLLAACEEEPVAPPRYPFTFNVHADGQGLEGVQLTVNDNLIGTTNAQGVLQVDLTGPEGSPVRVDATCPAGHRAADEAQVHNLRRVQSLDPATAARGIEVTFSCPPERRNAVVVVRTPEQTDLPIMLDGLEVARTDGSGVAHLAVNMVPGTTFQVRLDTGSNERLRPRSPSQSFTVPDHDEVFLLEQAFREERVRRRRVRRPPPRPASTLPVRIGSH